jgi:triacylglycerol lipase
VIQYTNAKEIIVISHSMGVTLARKIIKGGKTTDHIEGEYDVGPNLTSKIKTFIGLGGANIGLISCYDKTSYATCN